MGLEARLGSEDSSTCDGNPWRADRRDRWRRGHLVQPRLQPRLLSDRLRRECHCGSNRDRMLFGADLLRRGLWVGSVGALEAAGLIQGYLSGGAVRLSEVSNGWGMAKRSFRRRSFAKSCRTISITFGVLPTTSGFSRTTATQVRAVRLQYPQRLRTIKMQAWILAIVLPLASTSSWSAEGL